MFTKNIIIILLLAIVVGLGVYMFVFEDKLVVDTKMPHGTDTPSGTRFTEIHVPVFAEGGDMVCGVDIVFVKKQVAPTEALLNAVYREMFAMSEPYSTNGMQYQNPVGYQAVKKEFTPLRFIRAEITNGVASVYMEGSLTGVGTCYDPLPKIQLDAAAKQFSTVTSVKYYLNGKETDPGCIADQSGLWPCYTGTQ